MFCVGEKVFGLGLDLLLGHVLQLQPMGLMFFGGDKNFQLSEMKLLGEKNCGLGL